MDLPTGITTNTVPIYKILGYFFGYLISHIGITLYYKNSVKNLKLEPTNEEYIETEKYLKIINTWFPVLYTIILLGILFGVGL